MEEAFLRNAHQKWESCFLCSLLPSEQYCGITDITFVIVVLDRKKEQVKNASYIYRKKISALHESDV